MRYQFLLTVDAPVADVAEAAKVIADDLETLRDTWREEGGVPPVEFVAIGYVAELFSTEEAG